MMVRRWRLICGTALGVALCWSGATSGAATPVAGPGQAPIEYTVSLPAPQTQNVDITLRVPGVSGESIDFMLPVWRPGRYYLLDPASTVRQVRAFAADDQPLPVQKIDRSTWRVSTNGTHALRLAYRLYANSLGDRTRHVDDTHAFLDGAMTFMYVPQRRHDPLLIHVEAPREWRIACGLDALPDDPNTLSAPDYDTLADSPLEIGIHDVVEFEVQGKPHQIVIWGKADYDADQLKRDFAKIVETQAAIFGGVPYQRFVFILHVGAGAGGGTEHVNSTIMQTSRAALEEPDASKRLLSLAAHEMFHTWNVKQFRPAGIHPYDFQHDNYCRLLWVAEGTTSYYGGLTQVRAGFKSVDDYLDGLAGNIDGLRRRPGELVQSLEEASFDSWIQFEKTSPDNVNSTVSFYGKGALVSCLLDLTIRRHTLDGAGLDQVMRALYEKFPLSGPPYTPNGLQAIVEEVAGGAEFDDFFARYVRGAQPLDFEAAIAVVGLELYFKPSESKEDGGAQSQNNEPAQDADAGETDDDKPAKAATTSPQTQPSTPEAPAQAAYLGLNVSDQGGRAVVASVLADGPAYAAGILPGDEVLAIDGRKLTAGDLGTRLKKLKPGQTIQLTTFRREELRTVSITLAGKPDGAWKIRRVKEPTDQQKAAFESWLGQKWQ